MKSYLLWVFFIASLAWVNGISIPSKLVGEIKPGVKIGGRNDRFRRATEDYEAIRVVEFFDASIDQGISADIRNDIMNVIVPKLKNFLSSTLRVKPLPGPILLDRDCVNNKFVPSNDDNVNATQCFSTCEASTTCGEVVVPSEHLKQCVECNSTQTCESVGMDGDGVEASFVLYVSAITTGSCPTDSSSSDVSPSTVAFASSCQMESVFDRPIAGNVNFCPNAFSESRDVNFILDVTKHELLHALAFSTGLYAFWRDENGNPRTERDEFGSPPIENGGFVWSNSTILEVKYDDWEVISGTVDHTVNLLVTPAVVAEGKEHFDCSTLRGVELENQGGLGTQLSHWEKRILGDEFMTGVIDTNPIVSRFTLALLEDSGWYKVNYSNAEELLYGRNAGCVFATRSCLSFFNQQRTMSESLSPFCDGANPSELSCSLDRRYLAKCSLSSFSTDLPLEYQYFEDVRMGGQEIADYCPTYTSNFRFSASPDGSITTGTDCTNSENQPPDNRNGRGETYGSESKCFDHGSRWTVNAQSVTPYNAGCYKYSVDCETGLLNVDVQGTSYSCYMPGDVVNVDVNIYRGTIICPELDDIFCANFDANFTTPAAPTEPTSTNSPTDAGSGVSISTPNVMALLIGSIMSITHAYLIQTTL